MNILLIAGHGGNDPGACAFGKKESDLSRELVALIKNNLKKYECDVSVYPTDRSAYKDLIANGLTYNFKPYDYVLEVHFNAYKNDSGDGKVKGTEIYATKSEEIVSVEQSIVNNIAKLGFTNRGVKRKNFSVISEAKRQGVSSALLETCFIDDSDDMKIYSTKKNEVAQAVADGIAKGYNMKKKEVVTMAGFKDTKGHWAESSINLLSELGIINGYADGTFKPDKPITRAEVATMLARFLKEVNK